MTYSNSTTFAGISASIEVDEFNNINFYVNGFFDVMENNPCRVAITRWLLEEWEKIKKEYKYLFCIAYDEDYLFYDRVNSYKKLGFISLNGNAFIYLNFPNREEQEKTIEDLLRICPEEFSPISREWEDDFDLWVLKDVPELGFYKPVGLPIKVERISRQKLRVI